MSATDILSHEHRAIEVVLEAMEKCSHGLQAGRDVDPTIIADCLDFAANFADRCHHAKEEELLFPLLEKRGIARQGGPLEVMVREHDQGREYISAIRDELPKYEDGDGTVRGPLADALEGYATHLRAHIYKEDNVLFQVATGILTEEDNLQLEKGFDEIEQNKIGPGVHERYHEMLDGLDERTKDL